MLAKQTDSLTENCYGVIQVNIFLGKYSFR